MVHELVSDDYPYFDVREVWTPLLGAYTALNTLKETDTVFLSQLRPIVEEVNKSGALIEGVESNGPASGGVSVPLSAPNVGASSKAPTDSKVSSILISHCILATGSHHCAYIE